MLGVPTLGRGRSPRCCGLWPCNRSFSIPSGVTGLEECSCWDIGLECGLTFARIVALSSQRASLSSPSSERSWISGRSAGTLMDPWLEAREPDRKCSRCDSLFSPVVLDLVEDVDVLEALRRRESRFVMEWSFEGGALSLANVGGLMSSWVFVSERMMVNSGGVGGRSGAGMTEGVTSSLIFSFFLRRSFNGMLTVGKGALTSREGLGQQLSFGDSVS